MTAIRLNLILFIGYSFCAVGFIAAAAIWQLGLNPSLPLVPAACALCGLLCAGNAGIHWERIDD